jgi:hypothetical protein
LNQLYGCQPVDTERGHHRFNVGRSVLFALFASGRSGIRTSLQENCRLVLLVVLVLVLLVVVVMCCRALFLLLWHRLLVVVQCLVKQLLLPLGFSDLFWDQKHAMVLPAWEVKHPIHHSCKHHTRYAKTCGWAE